MRRQVWPMSAEVARSAADVGQSLAHSSRRLAPHRQRPVQFRPRSSQLRSALLDFGPLLGDPTPPLDGPPQRSWPPPSEGRRSRAPAMGRRAAAGDRPRGPARSRAAGGEAAPRAAAAAPARAAAAPRRRIESSAPAAARRNLPALGASSCEAASKWEHRVGSACHAVCRDVVLHALRASSRAATSGRPRRSGLGARQGHACEGPLVSKSVQNAASLYMLRKLCPRRALREGGGGGEIPQQIFKQLRSAAPISGQAPQTYTTNIEQIFLGARFE